MTAGCVGAACTSDSAWCGSRMAWSDTFDLGEWLPDQPDLSGPALRNANNVIPRSRGYDVWPSTVQANLGSLDAFCRGAFSSRTSSGVDFVVAGTTTKLWLAILLAFQDVTRAVGGAYGTNENWRFAIFGDTIIATNYVDPPQQFTIGTSTNFALLNPDAPLAKHCAVVREFLVLGNIVGQGASAAVYGTEENAVHWGAQGDPAGWPVPGTSAATAVLSDWQPLIDSGGEVTSLVGGLDYGLVFKKRSIHRMDFEGGSTFFRFTQIDANRGAHVPGSAIKVGGITYFISEDGVYATDGSGPATPIGSERVDRWLFAAMNFAKLDRVAPFYHPTLPLVGWFFMSKIAANDIMDTALIYNTQVNRFAYISQNVEWATPTIISGISMDSAPYATADMDSATPLLGTTDLDTLVGANNRVLGVFDSTHTLFGVAGPPVGGTIETYDFELTPGRVSNLRALRPYYKRAGTSITAQIRGHMQSGQTGTPTTAVLVGADGKFNIRTSNRFMSAILNLVGDYGEVHGLAADVEAMGQR